LTLFDRFPPLSFPVRHYLLSFPTPDSLHPFLMTRFAFLPSLHFCKKQDARTRRKEALNKQAMPSRFLSLIVAFSRSSYRTLFGAFNRNEEGGTEKRGQASSLGASVTHLTGLQSVHLYALVRFFFFDFGLWVCMSSFSFFLYVE